MNIMKEAIKLHAEAFSRCGDSEKSKARAEALRAEIDAACREARNPSKKSKFNNASVNDS